MSATIFWINGKPLELPKGFNNGDSVIPTLRGDLDPKGRNVLTCRLQSNGDIFQLWLIKKEIDVYAPETILVLMRVPYDRMDRVIRGKSFTFKAFAEFINDLGFYKVIMVDPHSEAAFIWIRNAVPIYLAANLLNRVMERAEVSKVAFPDEGAASRYGVNMTRVILLEKNRDPATEKITKLKYLSGKMEYGESVLLVDDVIDTGGTMLEAAKLLKVLGTGKIFVWAPHLLPIEYNSELVNSPLIERVYCLSSFVREPHEKVCEIDNGLLVDVIGTYCNLS